MAATRSGVGGYEDLNNQTHLRRNAMEDIEFLLAQGESLTLILKRLGIKRDTYEKWMERR